MSKSKSNFRIVWPRHGKLPLNCEQRPDTVKKNNFTLSREKKYEKEIHGISFKSHN